MDETTGRIVVGVDGSAASRAAVAYAVRDAARQGAWVHVVSAFDPPPYWAAAYGVPTPVVSAEDMRQIVLKETQQLVDEVIADLGPAVGFVPTEVSAVAGHPAHVLVDRAEGAAALVVGHRGRGGFAGLVLGSVALQCVQHATCPVIVVRARTDRDGE